VGEFLLSRRLLCAKGIIRGCFLVIGRVIGEVEEMFTRERWLIKISLTLEILIFVIPHIIWAAANARSRSAFKYSRHRSSRSLLYLPDDRSSLISDVIHDENRCTADFIQKICYHMSYVYQRSSGAVSLRIAPVFSTARLILDPAVYYAHLAGNRARVHDPSRDREDDSSSSTGGLSRSMGRMAIEASVPALRPLHANVQGSMWWM